jgi:glycosyltransferase involved in cell wall biosynthesis
VHHGVEVDLTCDRTSPREPGTAGAVLLAAGRLVEKKGFDTLVSACAELRRRGVAFTCLIFGTGPLLGALRRQVAASGLDGVVELSGWAAPHQLLDEMDRAAVLAMPSRVTRGGDRDGIPNVVLEAMAAGLPVVATNVSGIPEAVIPEETGLLVEPADVRALADAIERALTDAQLSAALGSRARRRIREEFTLDVASRRLAAIYGFDAGAAST